MHNDETCNEVSPVYRTKDEPWLLPGTSLKADERTPADSSGGRRCCLDFKDFLESNLVKFVTVDFRNDKEVLGWIDLVVGNPFDLQKNRLLPSGGQP